MRAILGRLLLTAASCIAALLLAEAALRFYGDRLLRAGDALEAGSVFDRDDPVTGFSLKPGASRLSMKGGDYVVRDTISSQGLRDLEHPIPAPTGQRRVLFLGDSFIYGYGVAMERSLPRRLAAMLPGTDVVNAGVLAWDLDQYYLWYGARGRAFRPDLVLVGFFLNDLTRDRNYESLDGPDGLPRAYRPTPEEVARRRRYDPRGVPGAVSSWLWRHSIVYALLRDRLDPAWQAAGRGAPPGPEGIPSVPYLPIFLLDAQAGPMRDTWPRAWRVLEALKRQVEQDGARFAVVIIPVPWQLDETAWSAWLASLGVDPALYGRSRPQEALRAWCVRTETPCLDLLEAFQGRDPDELHFSHDFHWTEAGHDLAAAAVRELVAGLL